LSVLGLSPTLIPILSETHLSEENNNQIIAGILFFVVFCWFRIAFACRIGKAAERRKSGYGWWVFATCFAGVIPIGIIYLLFVSMKPVAEEIESASTIARQEKSTTHPSV
jgi:hypothetical protein